MRSLQLGLIPDDENGEVLKRMIEDGDDLTLERPVEFFHVFADEEQANAFASAAGEMPLVAVEAPEVDEEDVWQVCVIRVMAPQHAAITKLESELGALAETCSGYADGWGCSPAERPH
jgi:regulator of RNase E activity RraB